MISNSWFVLKFRDKSLSKYDVHVHEPEGKGLHCYVYVTIVPHNKNQKRRDFTIQFTKNWMAEFGEHEEFLGTLGMYGDNAHSPLIVDFLRDLFQREGFLSLEGKSFTFASESEYSNRVFINEAGKLNFVRDPTLVAQENRFTRELVLKVLYRIQSSRGASSLNYVLEKCNFINFPVRHAIDALKDRDLIREDKANTLRLSYDGLSFVEDKLLSPFGDNIFLIAACRDEIYQLIERVYEPVADELGYKLRFQERSEPKGSIHDDIWQYIRDSKLIICDLTGKRPNCFIEYGYALARDKQIILSIEENEGKTKSGLIRVPFDTMTQKYSFWKKEWLDAKDDEGLENFKVEILERVKMKLNILNAELEI